MIRAIRPTATADTPVEWLAGWNVAPNDNYQVDVTPSAATVGVILSRGGVIVATGGCLPGTDQPVMLAPVPGQILDRIDTDLPWHLLISSPAGPASVTLAAMVDLPDEIHPIYQSDTLALSRATGLIDHGTHITADTTVTCPLGLGAGLGAVVAVPVDGQTVTGQVESITWAATPDGAIEQAVIRQHIPIAPAAPAPPPAPPVVADDTGATDAATTTSGNVLGNDDPGLSVVAVNGLSARVGQIVTGSNGGEFSIAATGAWTFDPAGDFGSLTGSDTATTSVTYHASDGTAEAMGTLTVTVSSGAAPELWTPAQITTALWLDYLDDATITLVGGKVSAWADKSGNNRHASMATDSLRPVVDNGIYFAGKRLNFASLTDVTGFCFYVVAARAGTQDHNTLVTISPHGSSSGNVARARLSWKTAQSYALGFSGGGGIGPNISPATNIDEFNIFGWRQSLSSPAMFDGSQFAASVSPAADSNGGVYALGTDGWNPGYFRIKEIVAVPAYSADANARIFGYLAHRHDLAAKLPSDHPYKSAAPTI